MPGVPASADWVAFKDCCCVPGFSCSAVGMRAMTTFAVLLILTVRSASADTLDPSPEPVAPGILLPTPEILAKNRGGGLYCVPAATGAMLDTMGWVGIAAWIRGHAAVRNSEWHGPMSLERLAKQLDEFGFPVTATFDGDASFLESVDLAVIGWRGSGNGHHAILFCGFVGNQAIVCDSLSRQPERCDKARFLAFWRKCSGRAVAIGGVR